MAITDREKTPPGLAPPASARGQNWLLVKLGKETFGIPVSRVQEIIGVIGISRLGDAPFPVRGALSLRDARIPVVDLRLRMGLGEGELLDSRVVVVKSRGRRLGLLVDSVERLSELDAVVPLPSDLRSTSTSYLCGLSQSETETILLLDLEQTLLVAGGSAEAVGASVGPGESAAAVEGR